MRSSCCSRRGSTSPPSPSPSPTRTGRASTPPRRSSRASGSSPWTSTYRSASATAASAGSRSPRRGKGSRSSCSPTRPSGRARPSRSAASSTPRRRGSRSWRSTARSATSARRPTRRRRNIFRPPSALRSTSARASSRSGGWKSTRAGSGETRSAFPPPSPSTSAARWSRSATIAVPGTRRSVPRPAPGPDRLRPRGRRLQRHRRFGRRVHLAGRRAERPVLLRAARRRGAPRHDRPVRPAERGVRPGAVEGERDPGGRGGRIGLRALRGGQRLLPHRPDPRRRRFPLRELRRADPPDDAPPPVRLQPQAVVRDVPQRPVRIRQVPRSAFPASLIAFPWRGGTALLGRRGVPREHDLHVERRRSPIPIRSDVAEYKKEKVSLGRLLFDQVFATREPAYFRAAAGMLETMFGGVDAEAALPLWNGRILAGASGSVVRKRAPERSVPVPRQRQLPHGAAPGTAERAGDRRGDRRQGGPVPRRRQGASGSPCRNSSAA